MGDDRMRLIRDERGFTLPELLITCIIALTVSLAAFSLLDFVLKRSGEIAVRAETTQRSRTAMDQITRLLRSQVCAWRSDDAVMTGSRSLYAAQPLGVTAFTDYTSESGALAPPVLRTLTYSNANYGTVTETSTPGQWNGGKVTYTGATTSSRQIVTNVSLYRDAGAPAPTPLLRYFEFNAADPPQPVQELGAGRALTDDELERVAKITITFRVSGVRRANETKGSTVLTNDIYVRTADPNADTPAPTCVTA